MLKYAIAFTLFGATQAVAGEPHEDPNMQCLSEAIYFEIGSNHYSIDQKRNVAWVILNRAESKYYPNTFCGVVRQANRNPDGSLKRGKCAFSYYCDGKPDVVPDDVLEQQAWREAKEIAELVINESIVGVKDPTNGAEHYHTLTVDPYWKNEEKVTINDEAHIFYDMYKD